MARINRWNRVRAGFNNDAWTGSVATPLGMGLCQPNVFGPLTMKRAIVYADVTVFVVWVPDDAHSLGYGWWQDVDLGLMVWYRQEPLETAPDWTPGDSDPRMLFSAMLHPHITPHSGVEDTLGDEYTVEWRMTNEPLQSHGERSIPIPLPGGGVQVSLYNSETNPEGVNFLDPALWTINVSGRCHVNVLWEGNE